MYSFGTRLEEFAAKSSIDIQVLTLLFSLLTSGTNSSDSNPAFLPPPQHLALISTLAIHPSWTTRAKEQEKVQAANLALRYLRSVLRIVGPLNADLQNAFVFVGLSTSTRRGKGSRRRTGDSGSPKSEDEENVNSNLANAGGIWARGQDFWQVVGWAFNCSVIYKRRWERWALWLEHMMEALKKDWKMKSKDTPGESLIVRYLHPGDDMVASGERRVLRAIFADGSTLSIAEFGEIWKNETKERRKKEDEEAAAMKKLRTKMNIDEENYGDYLDKSSSSDGDNIPPNPSESSPAPSDAQGQASEGSSPLGGPRAIELRLRLLALLADVSHIFPDSFINLGTLYDMFLTHIRPFPLLTFSLFTSTSALSVFKLGVASSWLEFIVRSLIEAAAPLPVDGSLTQEILEKSFLPWAANTTSVTNNAKISLCTEMLLRLLYEHDEVTWSEELEEAVERGIKAREAKSKLDARKKLKGEDARAVILLRASGERIRGIMELSKP